MPFFHFPQNNSGGGFHITDKLAHHVVIEASNAEFANIKLKALGGYFDGCNTGIDCGCCGDRWERVSDSDGQESPSLYSIYVWLYEANDQNRVVVHYADGSIVHYQH
jgi:hypothetical protein